MNRLKYFRDRKFYLDGTCGTNRGSDYPVGKYQFATQFSYRSFTYRTWLTLTYKPDTSGTWKHPRKVRHHVLFARLDCFRSHCRNRGNRGGVNHSLTSHKRAVVGRVRVAFRVRNGKRERSADTEIIRRPSLQRLQQAEIARTKEFLVAPRETEL